MDTPDVYPDVLGDALSFSSQRAAQLGSLVTAGATFLVSQRAERPLVAGGPRGVCPCSAVSLDRGTGGDQRAQLCGTLG